MRIDNAVPKSFSGCILITKGDETVYAGSFGYADIANKRENRIDTRFATASAGKVFVAVSILRLIEDGKLRFDSTIGELLDIDLKAIDPKITVEQLLTHTSGIPDYFDESVMDDYDELWRDFPNYKIRNSSALLPLFIDKPMKYAPGERFEYNNTGFVVLGMIIEAVCGIPFDKQLKKAVFLPCGMSDTGYFELDRLPGNCANGYLYDEERKEHYTNIYSVDVKGTGAGGAFTTVYDIKRFWDALTGGKLLSKKMTDAMLSPHAEDDGACYGYGIWLKQLDNADYMPYFQGCDPGVCFISSRDRDGTVVTAVSNTGDDVWQLHRDIKKLI